MTTTTPVPEKAGVAPSANFAQGSELESEPTADDNKPSTEAQKLRTRLRDAEARNLETETERDTLRETITNLQRAEVERLAVAAKLTPAAIWASGAVLADMLTDTGTVDPVKVDATIVNAMTVLGIPKPPVTPGTSGQGEGAAIGGGRTRTFADAFDPNRGRYDD